MAVLLLSPSFSLAYSNLTVVQILVILRGVCFY